MFKNIKAVLFDLDGTIYLGEELIPGAKEVVNRLREMGKEIYFMTNNSTKNRNEIKEKLNNMGLTCQLEEMYTSGYAAALYVKNNCYTDVFISGTDALKKEFFDMGINVTDKAKVMVIGYDKAFDYNKITDALQVGLSADVIIACNKERHYPVEGGKRLPGCGAMVGAIEGSLGRPVDYVVGKPNPLLLDIICKDTGHNSTDIMVIGDTYESDILMSKDYGCKSIYIGSDYKECTHVTSISRILDWL